MDTLPIITPEIFLDERCDASDCFEFVDGNFSLRFSWDDGPVQEQLLSYETIKAWDPKLLDVFETLLHRNMKVKTELIKITMASHWLYKNHRVDPDIPEDNQNRIHNRRLNKIVGIQWQPGGMAVVSVTLNIYRVAKTQAGLEYAAEEMTTTLHRPFAWLEYHYPGGEAILNLAQSLGADSEETAEMLQAVYIPHVITPVSDMVLPNDLGA